MASRRLNLTNQPDAEPPLDEAEPGQEPEPLADVGEANQTEPLAEDPAPLEQEALESIENDIQHIGLTAEERARALQDITEQTVSDSASASEARTAATDSVEEIATTEPATVECRRAGTIASCARNTGAVDYRTATPSSQSNLFGRSTCWHGSRLAAPT